MKKITLLIALTLSVTAFAQKKVYRSAESGRYVNKTTATNSPSTTYGTTRKSSSSSTSSTSSTTTSTTSRRSKRN